MSARPRKKLRLVTEQCEVKSDCAWSSSVLWLEDCESGNLVEIVIKDPWDLCAIRSWLDKIEAEWRRKLEECRP